MSLRDDFKAMRGQACDVAKRDVTDQVPALKGWLKGRKLFVRELSGPQRHVVEKEMSGDIIVNLDGTQTVKRDAEALRESRLICWCLADEKGERIFNDDDEEMVIAELTGQVVSVLSKAILRISGLSKQDKEDMAKNSETVAGSGSSSGSPVTSDGVVSNGALPTLAAAS